MPLIELSGQKRYFPFPYPLIYAGFIENEMSEDCSFYFDNRVEFTLRLDSDEAFAVDFVNETEYRTAYPHVFLKKPFVPFHYKFEKPRSAIYFSYTLPVYERLKTEGYIPETSFWPFEISPSIQVQIRRFLELLPHSREPYVSDRIDLLCFQLLEELLIQQRTHGVLENPSGLKIMEIASYIHMHPKCCLEDVIRKYGMSRRTFYRAWERQFNESPGEYILKMKMTDAARRLRETTETVSEIAERLGFTDSAYLSKCFRRIFHKTPGVYRNEFRRSAFPYSNSLSSLSARFS